MRGYNKKEFLELIETSIADFKNFYKQPFINYRGRTLDTKEFYTEIISQYLIENIEIFDKIEIVTRESSYKQGHTGTTTYDVSNRLEERIAMDMYNQAEIPGLGKIVDYQIPLKNKQLDKGLGKIDLLSIKDGELILLELKTPDSTETMLRCVLEGATYQRIVSLEKLKTDFGIIEETIFKSSPLVRYGGSQHKELKENRPYLIRLMELLESKPLFYHEENGKFKIIDNLEKNKGE